jgi:GAF domain-containing protein/CheY-like chemotaxis protein/anti-sigma regulatory factor (Ser/Thr protein kinase)
VGVRHHQPPQAASRRRATLRGPAIRPLVRAASRWFRRPAPERPSALDDGRSETFRALLEINKKINAAVPTEALLTGIAEEAARLLEVDNAGFRLVDGDELVVAGLAGTASQTMKRSRIGLGESLSGRVVTGGQPLRIELEEAADILIPEHLAADRRLGYSSYLGVPLRVGPRTIGILSFRARRPFTPRDQEVAEAFAGQAALALEQARLYRDTQRQAARMAALADVERLVAETLDADVVAQRIVDNVCGLLEARSAALYRLDEVTGRLVILTVSRERTLSFEWTRVLLADQGIAGYAVRARAAVWSADTFEDPRIAYAPDVAARIGRSTDRGLLAAPLVVRDRVIGALAVGDRTGRRFTDEDVRLAGAFAAQAAIALENARLHEESERRRRTAEHLSDLGRLLSQSLDPEEVGQRIVESVRALFGVMRCALYGAPPGDKDLVVLGFSNDPSLGTEFGRDLMFRHGIGAVGLAVSERRLVMSSDLLNDPRIPVTPEIHAAFAASPIRAALALPLVVGDTVIGVLATGDRAGRLFDEEEIRTLGAFADQAAVALENARLYRRAREYGDRLVALEEVNRRVSSSLQMEEVLQNLAAAVGQFFDAPYVSIWVFDPATQRLRRSVAHGDPQFSGGLRSELAIGEGLVGWVVQHREPILWTDVEHDPRAVDAARMAAYGIRYFTAYPIAIGDRLLGAFSVSRMTPPVLSPETGSLLGSLAAQAALALDHARLFAETRHRLDETRALLEVAEILTSTLDSTRLLRRVAMKIAQVCRVDRCSFSLLAGDAIVPVMSQFADGRRDPALWDAWARRGQHPAREAAGQAQAIATRRPVIIDDAARSDLVPSLWTEAYGVKSCMLVPLLRQDSVMGLMNLDYSERVTPFEPWQTDLAMAIAGQLALSLENSRLYTEAQERLRETTTLLAVGRVLSEPGDAEEVMRRVAREVGRAFGPDMVGAYVLDAQKEALVPVAGYHVPDNLRDFFRRQPIVLQRSPGMDEVWRSGRSVSSADVHDDPRFDPDWTRALPPHSVLLAPTQVRGESVGALFLVWWRPGREFPSGEVRLLEGVAAQVGLALENADLSRQTQAKLRETEALLSVSRSLSTTLDLATLFRQFLRRVASTLAADSVGIYLLGEDGEWMEPHTGYQIPRERFEELRRVRLSIAKHEFYAEAARTRRPMYSRDVTSDPRVPAAIRAVPHRSQLFVPIVARDEFIGGFAAVWWERERELSSSDLDLMEAIANQAAIAIANARLFEENRRQVEELSVLHELSRAVTGQLDRVALIEAVAAQVGRVLDARQMVVMLIDDELQQLQVAFRIVDGVRQPADERYPLRSVGLQSVVLETGRSLRTDDYVSECARYGVQPVARSAAFRFWLGVPMRAGDTTLGVIALRATDHPFSASDERVLTNIGQLAALQMRSARLFEERRRAYGELAAAQDQLVRTEKLRALGEMASGVAHDFNNVLAAILGRAQLLQRYVQDAKLAGWLQVIERSALDGAQTVRRLQEFARVRRDQPFGPVDLNAVIRDALEMTQSRWREDALRQGIVIDARTSTAPLATVAGDAAELREALTNLILNAVDAMPRGGTIKLSTAVSGDSVELTVTDTGMGIPPAVREKIFDPFFTTKGPEGTGLGLSMTYGILSRHGARIGVESEEGQGSTFRITFPRGEPLVTSPPLASPEPPPVDSLRCLVVDDERAVASVLGDVLEASGHRVVVLTDGAEAIARVRQEPFDVVFTDLAMPRVSGWDVAHAVKAAAPGLPVFLVTGFGVELSAAERAAHGVEAVFSKPLRIDDITRAVAGVTRYAGPRAAREGH